MYLRLLFLSFMPIALTEVIYLLGKKTRFGKVGEVKKQIFLGIVFGFLGLAETYLGIESGGYMTNIRDAAPLCAGLLFGAPAGIIAGIISGAERIVASRFVNITNFAGGVATILIGIYAAGFRKFLLEDKRPTPLIAMTFALIGETIHFISLLFFYFDDVYTTFTIIDFSALPMIFFTAFSVFASDLLVFYTSNDHITKKKSKNQLLVLFQRGLIFCVVAAFCVKIVFNFAVQSQFCSSETKNLLDSTINDIYLDISDYSDKNLLSVTEKILADYENGSLNLYKLVDKYNVTEVNIVNKNGIIVDTSCPEFLGYNMASGKQSAEFLTILDGADHYVQRYQPLSYNSNISRKYAGKALKNGGFIQVGYSFEQFESSIDEIVRYITLNRHPGKNGYTFICDEDYDLIGHSKNFPVEMYEPNVAKVGFESEGPLKIYKINIKDGGFYTMYQNCEGYKICAYIDSNTAVFPRNISFYITLFMDSVVFLALFVFVFIMVKVGVVNNIKKVNCFLSKITAGNLDTVVDVHSTEEFSSLSHDINTTVDTLKSLMREIETKNQKELEFAKKIQASVLPTEFPVNEKYSLYATMNTAKEVGGDFYDFFQIDENHLAIVMADVSGKGIPAALFMMESRTIIRSNLKTTCDPASALIVANNEICENNPMEMFVTVFAGVLDLETKILTFANAGHERPAVCRYGRSFELQKIRSGFVIGGMPGIKYVNETLQLNSGDIFYTYTDGIPEAVNESKEEFGNDRLITSLNSLKSFDLKHLCEKMYESVQDFAGTAPQFDDITMLAVHIK